MQNECPNSKRSDVRKFNRMSTEMVARSKSTFNWTELNEVDKWIEMKPHNRLCPDSDTIFRIKMFYRMLLCMHIFLLTLNFVTSIKHTLHKVTHRRTRTTTAMWVNRDSEREKDTLTMFVLLAFNFPFTLFAAATAAAIFTLIRV